jgi:Pentapeptide repeats (8 copies)
MTVDGVTEPGAVFPDVGGSAVIILVPIALFGASVFFLARQRPLWRFEPADLKAIGSSLLTGSLVSLAIFALQFYLDREDARQAKEEQFRLTLAVTKDLEGLDPPLPLAGLNLPDKVLDHAELAGEDLTDANLAGASLRSANLEGAQLEGANLYRADLEGAQMVGADLDNAVLSSANLRDATIYGPTGVELELDGTDVDARTCWSADFLTSAINQIEALRADLDPQPIVKTGREIRSEDIGRACELNFSDVIEHLEQPDPPPTLADMAFPYDDRPKRFLDAVGDTTGGREKEAPPLTLKTPLCDGAKRVMARHKGWQDTAAVLILRAPAQELGVARALLVAHEPEVEVAPEALLEPGTPLGQPVEAGTTVHLFGAVTRAQAGEDPEYVSKRRVSDC